MGDRLGVIIEAQQPLPGAAAIVVVLMHVLLLAET